MSKRVTIIAIACLFLIAGVIGILIFNQLSKKQEEIATTPVSTTSPFGEISGNVPNQQPTTEVSTSTRFGSSSTKQAVLVKVVGSPVAPGAFVQDQSGANVYFVDRATGNTFKYNMPGGFLTRMTNTTVPRVNTSWWSSDGKNVVLQTVTETNQIITYTSRLAPEKVSTTTKVASIELQGTQMSKNTAGITLNPATTKIFYYVIENGEAIGYIANIDGSKATRIFNSPITEWIVSWPVESTIVLTTKAASGVPGYSYSLQTKTGTLSQIIGNVPGLTTLPNTTLEKVALTNDRNQLQILTVATNALQNINLETIVEKCVWSKKEKNILYCAAPTDFQIGSYPDMWYQGLVSFTDMLYKIDTTTGKTERIADPYKEYKQYIDATNLSLSAQEDHLLFSNKLDYSLWTFNLTK
jgi:hypothetical protein